MTLIFIFPPKRVTGKVSLKRWYMPNPVTHSVPVQFNCTDAEAGKGGRDQTSASIQSNRKAPKLAIIRTNKASGPVENE